MTALPDPGLPSTADTAAPWRVYCLCAAWCGVCGEWRAEFDHVAAAHPGHSFVWIDIEDEAEVIGDVDVETFPTLLVARGEEPLFFGPVLPQRAGLTRLLTSLRESGGSGNGVARGLLARLRGVL